LDEKPTAKRWRERKGLSDDIYQKLGQNGVRPTNTAIERKEMKKEEALRLLEASALLLSKSTSSWTDASGNPDLHARNQKGQQVEPTDPTATSWTATGAMLKIAVQNRTSNGAQIIAANELCNAAVPEAQLNLIGLLNWNDELGRTSAHVVSAFRDAATNLRNQLGIKETRKQEVERELELLGYRMEENMAAYFTIGEGHSVIHIATDEYLEILPDHIIPLAQEWSLIESPFLE
jgi:hypothetical protein